MAWGQQYTTKYDTIDIDKILTNDRILSSYIKCLMEEGACTNEGRELKSKCTPYFTYFSRNKTMQIFFLLDVNSHFNVNFSEFENYKSILRNGQ